MTNTVISVADACRELGKPIVETGCGLLKALLGRPFEVAGEMITDELYRWQWERRIEVLEKADRRIKQRGTEAKVLPKGFFLSYLQNAGEIELTELQDLWANLLASAVESEDAQHPAFVQILKQISVTEARILANIGSGSTMFRKVSEAIHHPTGRVSRSQQPEKYLGFENIGASPQAILVALSHLSELGLITVQIESATDVQHAQSTGGAEFAEERGTIAFTSFGASFFSACVSEAREAPAKIVDGWTILRDLNEAANNAKYSAKEAGRSAGTAIKRLDNIKVATFD